MGLCFSCTTTKKDHFNNTHLSVVTEISSRQPNLEKLMKRSKLILAFSVFTFFFGANIPLSFAKKAAKTTSPAVFTAEGQLKQPVGYRKWVYVGTPVTPNDMNDGAAAFPEFHNVYMDPKSYEALEKTGKYRDGTVIVKELVSVGTKKASSGNGYFQGEFTGLEVSIKDSKRFKDEPGNWAYFSFGHSYPLKEVIAKNAATACNSCHEKNATSDWVFSEHYPVLRAAGAPNK